MLYVNKNGMFITFLSYFSGPLFNREEGPNLGDFEELKVFLGAHNHEAQFWNDPKYILQLLEAPAGHTQHNRMSENSLTQRPRCCHGNATLARIRSTSLAVDQAIDPTAVVGCYLLLKAINRPPGPCLLYTSPSPRDS